MESRADFWGTSCEYRIVPTAARIIPVGRRSGRYRFVITGCVRTWPIRDPFRADVDVQTGQVLAIESVPDSNRW